MQKNEQIFTITDQNSLQNCVFPLNPGDRIFLHGDLGAGKTTFIRQLLQKHFNDPKLIVRSPTYTYYQEYRDNIAPIYHFDLYRIEDLETFYMIGGMEIAQNPESIMLIEWPEILGESIKPNIIIRIALNDDATRTLKIQKIT